MCNRENLQDISIYWNLNFILILVKYFKFFIETKCLIPKQKAKLSQRALYIQ